MRLLATLLSAAGLAALAAFAGASSASTAPLGAVQTNIGRDAGHVQTVDHRGGDRHCHWRNGRKWCHGGHARGYDGYRYGNRPGIYLRFGFGDDGHRRHRRNYWR